MQIYSKTDKGMVRKSNQDAYFASVLDDGSVFVAVCDGMGGANAGNVASDTAVKSISDFVLKSYRKKMDNFSVSKMLNSAIESANIAIYDLSLKDNALSGMGTTAVVAVIRENMAIICHVGDSRAYIINSDICQLTRDHSVVQSLIESGKLTPDEAKVHPRKNVITRALGVEESVIADISEISVSSEDTLLFCTDGLTNFVESDDILKTVKSCNASEIPGKLVDLANQNGGGDNVTVVTVKI